MSIWELYWIMKLDNIVTVMENISILFGILSGIWFVAAVITWGIGLSDLELEAKEASIMLRKKLWPLPLIFFFILSIYTLIPTTKQMAALVILPPTFNYVAGNEKLKQLPENIVDLANTWIKELKPKEKK